MKPARLAGSIHSEYQDNLHMLRLFRGGPVIWMSPADAAKIGAADNDWIEAAIRSPVYALAVRHKVAFPLHPEYRTLPMVWYIPPLSPVADVVHANGYDPASPDRVFAAIDALRIPVEYLASLFTAGDPGLVRDVLRKLSAVRGRMRAAQLGQDPDPALPASVGPHGIGSYQPGSVQPAAGAQITLQRLSIWREA